MRLRLAVVVRALEPGQAHRPEGIADVVEGVDGVAGQQQRALHHGGLVVVRLLELRTDRVPDRVGAERAVREPQLRCG